MDVANYGQIVENRKTNEKIKRNFIDVTRVLCDTRKLINRKMTLDTDELPLLAAATASYETVRTKMSCPQPIIIESK